MPKKVHARCLLDLYLTFGFLYIAGVMQYACSILRSWRRDCCSDFPIRLG